jgi:hypothetical protein
MPTVTSCYYCGSLYKGRPGDRVKCPCCGQPIGGPDVDG